MKPGEGPDRHLQAALRHAPDADVQAPAALRERIVGAARAAIAVDRPAPWWRRLFEPGPLRLGASGAFATVLIAGVIGLLWRGETPSAMSPAVQAPAADSLASGPVPRVELPTRPELAKREPAPAMSTTTTTTAAKARAEPDRRAREAPPRRDEAADAPMAVGKVAAEAAPAAAPPPPPVAAAPTATIVTETMAPAAPPAAAPLQRAAGNAAEPRRELADHTMSLAAKQRPASSALSDDESAWLRELERTVQGRWRDAKDEAAAGTRERRFGRAPLDTRIVIGGGRVLWCDSKLAPVCREATLEPDEEKRLLETMPR